MTSKLLIHLNINVEHFEIKCGAFYLRLAFLNSLTKFLTFLVSLNSSGSEITITIDIVPDELAFNEDLFFCAMLVH